MCSLPMLIGKKVGKRSFKIKGLFCNRRVFNRGRRPKSREMLPSRAGEEWKQVCLEKNNLGTKESCLMCTYQPTTAFTGVGTLNIYTIDSYLSRPSHEQH